MMNLRKLSWNEIRKNQVSILAVIATLVVLWVVHSLWLGPGYLETSTLVTQVQQQKKLIEKLESKLNQGQGLRAQLENQEKELGQMRKGLFRGNDPYQLAASLSEMFSPRGSQELSIKSYQVLDTKEYGVYQQVRLKFYFMASIQGLHHFLASLDDSGTIIAVDNMDIRKGGGKGGTDLVVNVVLAALMEKGDKSEKNNT